MKYLITPDLRVYNLAQSESVLCVKPYYNFPADDDQEEKYEADVHFPWDEFYYFKTSKFARERLDSIKDQEPIGWVLSYHNDVIVELESEEQGKRIIRDILPHLGTQQFVKIYINKDLTVSSV